MDDILPLQRNEHSTHMDNPIPPFKDILHFADLFEHIYYLYTYSVTILHDSFQ